jgi:hypothetical protein
MWEQTPPPPSKDNASKEEKAVARQYVLHSKMISQSPKLQPSEGLGEDVGILFRGRTKLQINDLFMY